MELLNFQMELGPLGCSDEGDVRWGGCLLVIISFPVPCLLLGYWRVGVVVQGGSLLLGQRLGLCFWVEKGDPALLMC